jgi:Virulence factor
MAKLTTVYWRDIPAQIIIKAGRNKAKRQLSDRFLAAIDMAAMHSNALDSNAYLQEWRREGPLECGDDIEAEADKAAEQLEADFNNKKLREIAKNGGRTDG